MLRNTLIIAPALALVPLAAGCMAGPGEEYKNAVPTSDTLTIDVPGEGSGSEAGAARAPLLGERADFYQATRNTSRAVNGSLWMIGQVLEHIVSYPPTEVHEDSAVWGPWNETLNPLTYVLLVEKTDATHYRYVLRGKPRLEGDEAYVDLIAGETEIDEAAGIRRGTIGIDFDAAHALDPAEHPEQGRIAAEWDEGAEPRYVEAAFEDFVGRHEDRPASALYRYRESRDRSGTFEFGVEVDLEGSESPEPEQLVLMSRWDRSGAGRGDALVTGGDLGDAVVNASECWDVHFDRVFWNDNAALQPNEGAATACAYSEPLWSDMPMD